MLHVRRDNAQVKGVDAQDKVAHLEGKGVATGEDHLIEGLPVGQLKKVEHDGGARLAACIEIKADEGNRAALRTKIVFHKGSLHTVQCQGGLKAFAFHCIASCAPEKTVRQRCLLCSL